MITGRSSELLAFSGMMLCHVSLVTIVVLVAGNGLPVNCPPYILTYPGITPVGRGGRQEAKRDCTAVLRDRRMAAVTHLGYMYSAI